MFMNEWDEGLEAIRELVERLTAESEEDKKNKWSRGQDICGGEAGPSVIRPYVGEEVELQAHVQIYGRLWDRIVRDLEWLIRERTDEELKHER